MTRDHFPICVHPLLLGALPRHTSLWWIFPAAQGAPGVLPLTPPYTPPPSSHSWRARVPPMPQAPSHLRPSALPYCCAPMLFLAIQCSLTALVSLLLQCQPREAFPSTALDTVVCLRPGLFLALSHFPMTPFTTRDRN